MEIRKMSASELDKAIKEEIKRLRGYEAWRKNGSPPPPSKRPEARAPSKSEQYLDACKLAAEYRAISIEQLFKQEPQRYKQYRRLVLEE